jgi:hypothetical protein
MKTQPITEYNKEALKEIHEHLAFLERRIDFYTQSIKSYLDIKELYQKSANIINNGIKENLSAIAYVKKHGTKQQLQTSKNNLHWFKNQLKFEKEGLKWCNEGINGNKTELAFWQKSLKKLIKEKLV